ncbi:MAG: TonB-dependent receptor [Gammaproteobacteria bacterium]
MPRLVAVVSAILLALTLAPARAHETPIEEITVTGRAQSLVGAAESASQGVIGASDLVTRPVLRAGELLEVVPGAAVTQHSGTGKANQYFLRGFNLDHGTDFAGFVDGVPLNLPTHGHGQGYLDLNPIIPELVERISFGKGPYYADVGDFASAGYVRYSLMRHVHEPLLELTVGENDFYRAVGAASVPLGGADVLGAFEAQYYDGPWVLEEDASKVNGLLRLSGTIAETSYSASLSIYDADWNSTDQIPARAIRRGLVSRRGNIDPTLGGESERYAANLELEGAAAGGRFRANAYAVYADFELYSNFTYFLDDPVAGDQITQLDRRWIAGLNSAWEFEHTLLGRPAATTLGVQVRHDRVLDVALRRSRARRLRSTVRDDRAEQTSLGVYFDNEIELTPWLRSRLGLRASQFWFDVDGLLAANSGSASDDELSPKAALIFGPWRDTELYLNFGMAFHSNDARGTVTRIDPASGAAAMPVDPLVESRGAEVGLRTAFVDGLQSTLALWYLELDSELVFVGDAGTTEPSGESRRYGVEWSNFYRATDWLTLDLDVAFTQPEFTGVADDEIPNSVGRVVTAGATVDFPGGVFGSLRLRHFGDSPLTEDGRVEADATTVVNLRAGYRFSPRAELALDVFNLFDSKDPDISYFFESCLPSDPPAQCGAGLAERAGVADVHLHPVEPRQVRATLTLRF